MPGSETGDDPVPDLVSPAVLEEIPTPDPGVVDSARLRLAARQAMIGRRDLDRVPTEPTDDLRAIASLLDLAAARGTSPADAIDVGAGLVVLSGLRIHLDCLETSLLDLAQQVGLSWDVIAAILGIPAERAQRRHSVLRSRRDAPPPR
jgi:hypothetical protein